MFVVMKRTFLILTLLLGLFGCSNGELCDPGTVGCPCLSDGSCRLATLACMEGTCVEPAPICEGDRCAPGIPKCYSPCQNDLITPEGELVQCSEEGLLEGCVGESTCVRGTCFASGMSALVGTCRRDTDCPDFQACIQGACYSNCEGDSECATDEECYRHVCRTKCSDVNPCPSDELACLFSGVCIPLTPPGDLEPTYEAGDLVVAPRRIAFNTNVPQVVVEITNDSPNVQTFVVRKTEQRTVNEDGSLDIRRASEGETPLVWLEMGVGTPLRVQELPITIPSQGTVELILSGAKTDAYARWEGRLEISSERLGTETVSLQFVEEVPGRWAGRVFYFGNFADGARPDLGQFPLETWRMDRGNASLLNGIPNAFLQAWGRFRNNAFSLVEMEALLQATITGSWQFERVQQLCEEAGFGSNAACALFGGSGSASVIPYTSAVNVNRIPSGVVEMNVVINLEDASFENVGDPEVCSRPGLTPGDPQHCFVGRIESSESLQYGGNPEVFLRFEEDPLTCQRQGELGCVSYLADFGAEISVGARYVPAADDLGCARAEGLERRSVPWLIPGFTAAGGGEERTECRDTITPFAGQPDLNKSYAGANPVPDGRPRRRTLELIDGMMVEQHVMLLLVREKVDPFHGGEPFTSYAYVLLERSDRDLEPEEVRGNRPRDDREDESALDVSCSPDLIRAVTRRPSVSLERLSTRDRLNLARAVVTGRTSTGSLAVSDVMEEQVHYVCVWSEDAVVDTGTGIDDPIRQQREVFNSGPDGTVPCPLGAAVVYFALDNADFMQEGGASFDPRHETCNSFTSGSPENCLSQLESWIMQGRGVRLMHRDRMLFPAAPEDIFTLSFECDVPGRASCEDDRFDLRAGKTFFAENPAEIYFNRVETDIHQAFRYRTQFVTGTGRNVGFTPTICQDGSNLVPYCYDPEVIESIVERVDCALALYHDHLENGSLSDDAANVLRTYLTKNFAVLQRDNPLGDPLLEHGFERLYAELLIMLGDDALTASFGSRFDLAATRQLAFEGSRFEVNGADLSGIAGFELYKLYQAAQYYETVLDRFYRLTPMLWEDITGADPLPYVRQETVTSYIDRVIRASTQLATTANEIARRYQNINRPDLSRRVLERAYTRAYQESQILSAIIEQIATIVSPAQVDQVIKAVDDAQRSYRVAMIDMQSRYDRIGDAINLFGLPPDYIPFPALDEDDVNGFEVILDRAKSTMEVAAEQEQRALESTREFDVDEAEFQAELVEIRNNYDAQLAEICGSFVGTDGRVYPAISRYAHLSEELSSMDDPCGAAGNGAIWLKYADIETRRLELQRVRQEIQNVRERERIAEESVAAQCQLIQEDVAKFLENQRAVNGLQTTIDSLEFTNSQLDKLLDFMTEFTGRVADQGDDMTPWATAAGAAGTTAFIVASTAHFIATATLEGIILGKQVEIRNLEQEYEAYNIGRQCDYLTVELAFTVREIHLDMGLLELDALNAIWNLQVDLALLGGLDNERRRLTAEFEEAEQLAINVAAAKNDPNIRIYKNDAVINADRSFERALREAYRLTRIYEYYTSQSYPFFDKLFLVRMIDAGQPNLRNYLAELEDEFFAFEDTYGNPDTRVASISIRDDIFGLPRYAVDGSGAALAADDRAEMFRERFLDQSLLDDNGWITVKFDTNFTHVSPLTHNHKILFIEVEFFGDVGGDDVGRVYLRQTGTGVLRDLGGGRLYFAFPPRIAVMNPVLNGNRDFGQDSDGAIAGPVRTIFRSFRFRERPFINTSWELVFNQRTESVNQDINLNGLDDIRINVFYTDFTGQ